MESWEALSDLEREEYEQIPSREVVDGEKVSRRSRFIKNKKRSSSQNQ